MQEQGELGAHWAVVLGHMGNPIFLVCDIEKLDFTGRLPGKVRFFDAGLSWERPGCSVGSQQVADASC